ncbi:MAG: hypothetical protein ACFB6R_02185 [Alphaproteobacteria bacterium]
MEFIQDVVTQTRTLSGPLSGPTGVRPAGMSDAVILSRRWGERPPVARSPLRERFQDLGLAYVLSEADSARLSKSIAVVRRLLKFALGSEIQGLRLIGSHVRHTRVAPHFDDQACVDGLVCFRSDRRPPDACVALIAHVMEAWLPSDFIDVYRDSVEIDMMGHRLRLIPGQQTRDGQLHVAGLSRNPEAGTRPWIPFDPDGTAAAVRDSDSRHSNLITPVIRILKTWNIHAGRPFTGFELEEAVLGQRFRSTRQITFMTLEAMAGLPEPKQRSASVHTTLKDLKTAAREAAALERTRRFPEAMDVMTPHLMPERAVGAHPLLTGFS